MWIRLQASFHFCTCAFCAWIFYELKDAIALLCTSISLFYWVFNFFFNLFERRETSIYCCSYLCIQWWIHVCALTGDLTCNHAISGWHFNKLSYLARGRYWVFWFSEEGVFIFNVSKLYIPVRVRGNMSLSHTALITLISVCVCLIHYIWIRIRITDIAYSDECHSAPAGASIRDLQSGLYTCICFEIWIF